MRKLIQLCSDSEAERFARTRFLISLETTGINSPCNEEFEATFDYDYLTGYSSEYLR